VRQHGHVLCDNPGCGAVTYLSSQRLRYWQAVEWEGGQTIDLCPNCAETREAGQLHAWAVCSRCGRTDEDGVEQFWGVPADETAHRPWDNATRDRMLCDDCLDRGRDHFRYEGGRWQ
jgi:hypothetical protein